MEIEGTYVKMEENNQELRGFFLSIILSCIGISIITIFISFIPILKEVFWSVDQQPLNYSNFFYKWTYSQWTDEYTLTLFRPSLGYYIFSPIAGLFLLISNSCILIKDRKKTKQLIFINWGLFILPISAFIIKISLIAVANEVAMPFFVIPILITLGFYVLIYLPIQIMLLIEKKSLRQFFALHKKEQGIDRNEFVGRRINAFITLLIYLYAIGLLFHSAYSEIEFFAERNKYAVTILMLLWFISNIAIYRYKFFNRIKKDLFSLFSGITSFLIIYFIVYMANPLIIMEMMSFSVYNLQFPETLIITLFYSTIMLLVSIPIGFFGFNKKDIAIIVSLFSIPVLVFGIFVIIEAFHEDFIKQGAEIFYIFKRIFYLFLLYAGAFWGDFLGKKVYQ